MEFVGTVLAVTAGPKMFVESCRSTGANLREVASTMEEIDSEVGKAVRSADNIVEALAIVGVGGLALGATAVVGTAGSVIGGALTGAGRTVKWLFGG